MEFVKSNILVIRDKIWKQAVFFRLTKDLIKDMLLKHFYGAVAEWFKAAVLKTVVLQGTGGSNPPCSESFWIQARKRGRAVIQRIANPSVPKGPGRFNSCRLR